MIGAVGDGRTEVAPLQLHGSLAPLIAAGGSGRAVLTRDSVSRTVWFDAGTVVAVTSSLEDEKLGSWLAARGVVPAPAVRQALASQAAGERLGGILVRAALITPEKLLSELESLALAVLGRAALAGGELTGDAAASLPADARMVAAPAQALLVAALRRIDDIEPLGLLLEQSPAWVVADVPDAPADTSILDTSQRYLLSLLKRPRTLDNLRRAALIDFTELIRGVAALVAAGMVVPCRVAHVPPSARVPDAAEAAPGAAAPGDAASAGEASPRPTSGLFTARRNVREALAALDAAEESRLDLRTLDGQEASGAQRHRVATLVDTAAQLRDSGQDRRGARQMLGRALDVFPAVSVMLLLADLELAEPHLRAQGLERLQRVLASAPRSTAGWLMLARYWADRQQPDKVRACAAKILAYDPANPDARALAAPPQ